MVQCTKDELGARVVAPADCGTKNELLLSRVNFFLCSSIFYQDSFLGFINGKNCWQSNCSCVRQLYEMKGLKFVISREMH